MTPSTPSRRRWARWLMYLAMTALAAFFLAPILWQVATSFKSLEETADPLRWWPARWQWHNYPEALLRLQFETTFANTIFIAVGCIVGQVLSSSMVGYAFAVFRFPGRDPLFLVMLATMMLPSQVTMIPVFALMRSLGLVDNLFSLILPAWFGSAYFIYMFRQFFAQVPRALIEAAQIDGASHFWIYWRIMLPVSRPVIAIVAVYTFIFSWNDYFGPLVYLNSPENYTLSQALAGFDSVDGASPVHLMMAASLVTILPCIVLFFFAQRFFAGADHASAVKG